MGNDHRGEPPAEQADADCQVIRASTRNSTREKRMNKQTRLMGAVVLAWLLGQAAGVSAQTTPPGPVAGTRLTEGYVRQVAQSAYLWAWPMVNIRSRHAAYEK